MNRIEITVTAYRRPKHLARCLIAQDIAQTVYCGESPDPWISIDHSEHAGEAEAVFSAARLYYGRRRIRVNDPKFGLWPHENNALQTYDWAFHETDCRAIVAIEDDCLLAPDALQLCSWFLDNHTGEYLFLNLANCNQPTACLGRELDVVESTRIVSPWAWCFTRAAWESRIRPQWNHLAGEGGSPKGWDWSLSASMEQHGWKSLMPVLPRARNIGRDLGENGGAILFDETLAKAACSDGTWGDEFRLVQ